MKMDRQWTPGTLKIKVFTWKVFKIHGFNGFSNLAPKCPPLERQKLPKWMPNELQERPRKPQEWPKTAPRAPRSAPRAPKERPKRAQEPPKRPRRPQERPKSAPRAILE